MGLQSTEQQKRKSARIAEWYCWMNKVEVFVDYAEYAAMHCSSLELYFELIILSATEVIKSWFICQLFPSYPAATSNNIIYKHLSPEILNY